MMIFEQNGSCDQKIYLLKFPKVYTYYFISTLAKAVCEDINLSRSDYYRKIKCKKYTSKDECMKVIDKGGSNIPSKYPNIMTAESGDVFTGGRYHSLVPITRYELT